MLVGLDSLRERAEGRARNGTISLRAFDLGIVETLGGELWLSATEKAVPGLNIDLDVPVKDAEGELVHDHFHECVDEDEISPFPAYFVQVPGVEPAPGFPGVPVVMDDPEDLFQHYLQPIFWIDRQDFIPAMNRWHPANEQYRTPARGALPVVFDGDQGFNRYEQRQQAAPFDINYSLMIESRGGVKTRTIANLLLMFALKKFPPYGAVVCRDDFGDIRTYFTAMESASPLDETDQVTVKTLGFSLALRIEAELDVNDTEVKTAVTDSPTLNLSQQS